MINNPHMYVIKRKGNIEPVNFDKIHCRIKWMARDPFELEHINPSELAQMVIQGLHHHIQTRQIDEYTSNLAASLSAKHYEYGILAGRIIINNCHKNTLNTFSDKMKTLYLRKEKQGSIHPLIHDDIYKFVKKNQKRIDAYIDYERDYRLDFFSYRTLEKGYLLRIGDDIIERPQDMFMRVSIFIHLDTHITETTFTNIFNTYDLMSKQYMTHATPTLFNAGTPTPSNFSCYLLGTEDSRKGILKTLDDTTLISKWAGGIGFHISDWRSEGAPIRGTNGTSSGIVPFLRMFNDGARAFNQGGKRQGSFAAYLEPHHPDIMHFLHLRRTHGDENLRCRDLFLALWVSDLFMKRVENDGLWSTFCPLQCPDLTDTYGDAYEKLYVKYEQEQKYKTQIKARDIWKAVYDSQKESGLPYILYKDTVNRYSMQQHLGTIKSSNLCVSGDTLILTDHGYDSIRSLTQTDPPVHHVWNGETFASALFAQTGFQQQLVQITCSDGSFLKCTMYHRWITSQGDIKDASQLRIGDKLMTISFPVIDDGPSLPDAYTYGLTDATGIVPMQYNLYTKLEWLSGVMDAYGSCEGSYLKLTIDDAVCLYHIKLLCQTLGTNPWIDKTSLIWMEYDVCVLYHQGLHPRRIERPRTEPLRSRPRPHETLTVVSIEYLEYRDDTFCFKESKLEQGVFNGILTKNCAEIVEYSDDSEYAVCCLSSICLPMFVEDCYTEEELQQPDTERRALDHTFPMHPVFNYKSLADITGQVVVNLNKIIDKSWYPCVETIRSNFKHRPLGIGVQGLADVFCKFKVPFDSDAARQLNRAIFETIYYGALSKSTELARQDVLSIRNDIQQDGKAIRQLYEKHHLKQFPILKTEQDKIVYTSIDDIPPYAGAYPSYTTNGGTPIARDGQFHWERMGLQASDLTGMFDWETVRRHIKRYGLKNSLLTALMPTASTSQIMGNTESFEPYKSNIYKRKTLAGEFIVINKYLMHDLFRFGLWNDKVKHSLMLNNGSIQHIEGIPQYLKDIYKTIWELKQRVIIDLAADRQPFIDQSQSMNLHVEQLTFNKFNNMQFYAWKHQLKTGCYYLRSRPAVDAQKFTIDMDETRELEMDMYLHKSVSIPTEDDEICLMCSS